MVISASSVWRKRIPKCLCYHHHYHHRHHHHCHCRHYQQQCHYLHRHYHRHPRHCFHHHTAGCRIFPAVLSWTVFPQYLKLVYLTKISHYGHHHVPRLWRNLISAAVMRNFWTHCWIWKSLDGWLLQQQVWENFQTLSEDLLSKNFQLLIVYLELFFKKSDVQKSIQFCYCSCGLFWWISSDFIFCLFCAHRVSDQSVHAATDKEDG